MQTNTKLMYEPVAPADGRTLTTDQARRVCRRPVDLGEELEAAIIEILQRPIASSETHHEGNARRELELRGVFAKLTPLQAFELGRRLDANRDNDPVAVAFRRVIVERRQRLRAFLADLRRRRA